MEPLMFDKIKDFLTWGKVAFTIVSVVGAFATFVAGKIYGASVRDAEIEEHTAQIKVHKDRLDGHDTKFMSIDMRVTATEAAQVNLNESVRKLESAVAESNGKLDVLLHHLIPNHTPAGPK
jgi:hypothetical protein